MKAIKWRFRHPFVFNGWHMYGETFKVAFRDWLGCEWRELRDAITGRKPLDISGEFRKRK